MRRLVNSSLYGNRYMPDEELADLNGAIFVMGEKPDTFKKNLQSTYVNLLITGFKKTLKLVTLASLYTYKNTLLI